MNKALVKLIDRITPGCEKVAMLSSERLDRRLTLKERISVRLHFLICYFCRRYHDQLELMHQQLATKSEEFGQKTGKCLCAEEKAKLKEACRKGAT